MYAIRSYYGSDVVARIRIRKHLLAGRHHRQDQKDRYEKELTNGRYKICGDSPHSLSFPDLMVLIDTARTSLFQILIMPEGALTPGQDGAMNTKG